MDNKQKIRGGIALIAFGSFFLILGLIISGGSDDTFMSGYCIFTGIGCLLGGICLYSSGNEQKNKEEQENRRRQECRTRYTPLVERCRTIFNNTISTFPACHKCNNDIIIDQKKEWINYICVNDSGELLLIQDDIPSFKHLDIISNYNEYYASFDYKRYTFENSIVFRCKISDISYFKVTGDVKYTTSVHGGTITGSNGHYFSEEVYSTTHEHDSRQTVLRVGTKQLTFGHSAYDVFMQLIPDKEFDYIMATKNNIQ